jgi:putative transcriptional regulator
MFMNPIKQLRKRLGVTQTALATGIGVSQANVSFYESGQQMPPNVAQRLITYAHGLGHTVTYDDIYGVPPVPRRRRASDQQGAEPSS